MSTIETCPDLEVLFLALEDREPWAREHLAHCEGCAAVFEEHRLLEQQLTRVMDPPPPRDFVQQVMARVAEAPAPRRRETLVGSAILVTAILSALGIFLAGAPSLEQLGLKTTSRLMNGRHWVEGLAGSLEVVWSVAGPQLLTFVGVLFLLCLFGLRRLAGGAPAVEA
jgi:hypothetical protein